MPFGGVSDRILGCAFLEGLPIDVSRPLRASSKPGEMSKGQLLAWARTILKESEYIAAAAKTEEVSPKSEGSTAGKFRVPRTREGPKCYKCGGPSHFSQECRSQSDTRTGIEANHIATAVTAWATLSRIVQETGSEARNCRHPCPLSVSKCGSTGDQFTRKWRAVYGSHRYRMFPFNNQCNRCTGLE